MRLKMRILQTFLISLCYLYVFTGELNASTNAWKNFSMKKEPKPLDWKNFFESSGLSRKQMWHKLVGEQKHFKDLHWSWRMAWVKSCTFSNESYCLALLKEALIEDKALVVRAEAATRLGDRFEKSGNKDAVDLLSQSFKNQFNHRNNKPLFIQTRILDSIYRIGGKHGLVIATKLAETSNETRDYWKKRSKSAK